VNTIMEKFGFRESLGGLLQVSYFVGGFTGILLITFLMQKYSTKQILLGSSFLLSFSLLGCSISPWYPFLLVLFAFAGFGNGILITYPGVYVTRILSEESITAQSLLYSFFSLGVLSGPIIIGWIIKSGISWRWAFATPAILIIPLSIPVAFAKFEEIEGVEVVKPSTIREILIKNRVLFLGLLSSLILYIAAESAVSMWLVTFFFKKHGLSEGYGHWILSGLWAGITLGRWICGWASRRISPFRILIFLSISAGFTLLAAPLSGSRIAAIVLYPFVGLFYSGIYPFLIGYTSRFPSEHSSAVFTLFLAAGTVGGATLPYIVGLLNQFVGFVAGMSLISLPLFAILFFMYWIRNQIAF